jgi:Na+-translocating ferredoxin:NAD+ oxidoreductase RnfC subunit
VPITRLLQKLAIQQYSVPAPLQDEVLAPAQVVIKLQQHIGAPARAVVGEGERVVAGQLLGEIPEGSLGARVHASIDGTVTAVTPEAVTIRR